MDSLKVEFLIFLLFIGVVVAALIAAFAFFVFRGGAQFLPKSEVSIGDTTLSVEVARGAAEKMRGLSGRDSLGEREGMLFVFDKDGNYGFWMKDMKFPIDIIWIRKGRVVGFSENAVPEPGTHVWNLIIYYPPDAIDSVLEVNAGFVAKNGIRVGDEISF